ncbi:SCO family protein [Cesiribacter sp. SM1]|uniref:SCO family protein n=1 Tax=Cesiribacter sp. SM1 TaxID=2861196 RepID=UPI001CD5938D|nr:SCO family protein [Cesiribacter sp. SM1]
MRKTVFLFILLLIPVAIVLFLHRFGENRYEIPVYYSNAAEMSSDICVFPEGQHLIPPFTFSDQDNRPTSEEWLTDKITVVDFIFTNCPSMCKEMSAEMLRVQEAFRDDAQLQLLSFTVDPEHDQPQVLKEYASRVGVDEKNWRFLTGDKAPLYEVARCGFLLPVQEGDGGSEDFIHSNKFVLVDGQRRIRGYYDGDDRQEVDRLIQEIRILKTEF